VLLCDCGLEVLLGRKQVLLLIQRVNS